MAFRRYLMIAAVEYHVLCLPVSLQSYGAGSGGQAESSNGDGSSQTGGLAPVPTASSQLSLSLQPEFRYSHQLYAPVGVYRGRLCAVKRIRRRSPLVITRGIKMHLNMVRSVGGGSCGLLALDSRILPLDFWSNSPPETVKKSRGNLFAGVTEYSTVPCSQIWRRSDNVLHSPWILSLDSWCDGIPGVSKKSTLTLSARVNRGKFCGK